MSDRNWWSQFRRAKASGHEFVTESEDSDQDGKQRSGNNPTQEPGSINDTTGDTRASEPLFAASAASQRSQHPAGPDLDAYRYRIDDSSPLAQLMLAPGSGLSAPRPRARRWTKSSSSSHSRRAQPNQARGGSSLSDSQHHGNKQATSARKRRRDEVEEDDDDDDDDHDRRPFPLIGPSRASMPGLLNMSKTPNFRNKLRVVEDKDGRPVITSPAGSTLPSTVAALYGNGISMPVSGLDQALDRVKTAAKMVSEVGYNGMASAHIVPMDRIRVRGTGSAGENRNIRASLGPTKMFFRRPTPKPNERPAAAAQEPEIGICKLCKSITHRTGRCPWSQNAQGDVATCPWHHLTAKDDPPHVLDALHVTDSFGKSVGCRDFSVLDRTIEADLEALIEVLVVQRQLEAPLRVKTEAHCFVRLGVYYADRYFGGKMPPKIGFVWPYLKHEAVRYSGQLAELAQGQRAKADMPPSVLNGKSIDEIKDMLRSGEIVPQAQTKDTHAIKTEEEVLTAPWADKAIGEQVTASAPKAPAKRSLRIATKDNIPPLLWRVLVSSAEQKQLEADLSHAVRLIDTESTNDDCIDIVWLKATLLADYIKYPEIEQALFECGWIYK